MFGLVDPDLVIEIMKTTMTNDLLEVAAATWWPPVTDDELSDEEQSPETADRGCSATPVS